MTRYPLKEVWRARKKELPLFVRLYTDVSTLLLAYIVANFSDLTPNALTLINHTLALLGGVLFLINWKIGIFLLWFGFQFDGVDGIVARLKNEKSKLGELLEEYLYIGSLAPIFIAVAFYMRFNTVLPLLLISVAFWSKLFVYTSFHMLSSLEKGTKLYQGKLKSKLPKINWFGKTAYITYKGFFSLGFYISALLGNLDLVYSFWLLSLLEGIVENVLKGTMFLIKVTKKK